MTNEKMDLLWGIHQMERELADNNSPANNIMSICTEVQKQVNEMIIEKDKARDDEIDKKKKQVQELIIKLTDIGYRYCDVGQYINKNEFIYAIFPDCKEPTDNGKKKE